MFPTRSRRTVVERKATKKTGCSVQHPARKHPLGLRLRKVNRVTRIGALTRGQSKKLPWVDAIASELAKLPSGQSGCPKESRSLAGLPRKNGCCGGVTRPSGRIAGFRPGYTSLSATARRFWRVILGTTPFGMPKKVGAATDRRKRCSVNTAESASRLVRFTDAPSGRGGLNGWGNCAPRRQ